ncbi:unnamed protein product [Auanema sp. JU1783]|nr:unnamed protein product [Auanema sp. JU1783]
MPEVEEVLEKPALPVVPPNCGPPTIALSHLIDFAVQQIYHELTVLSELLPKKLDSDRKISLVQFAHSTRMLFVKLLALVKWVKSSKKFEASSAICYLLDLQSNYFVETADRLCTFTREELVLARLPQFQITAAVDVLAQGTFSRLPLCIKDTIIKESKISPKEQAQVLMRLNQILQYRVSRLAAKLSPRIKEIKIRNGMVTLVVPGEFEAALTVLGETDNTKWTLLNIKMLVEDHEIGYGTQLAHPLQLNLIHNVIQSRMNVANNPLNEVYSVLHSFAQTLQLDVLFCQCSQLSAGRLRGKILIEKYDVKERSLTVGYWVQRVSHRKGSVHVRLVPQYRVTIYGSSEEDTPLRVKHSPNFPNLGQLDDRTGRLSIDRLLSETFAVRCRERLLRIRKRLEAAEPKALIALTGQAAPCLYFPLLRDSVDNVEECLYVSVSMSTGKVLCTISAIETSGAKKIKELEKVLYDCHSVELLRKLLDSLKVLIMISRYRKSVAALQVRIINEAQMAPFFSKVRSLPPDRICLQFIKEEQYYLVVTFKPDNNLSIEVGLFLISVAEENVQLLELVKDLPHVAAPLDRIVTLEANTYGATNEEDDWKPQPKRQKIERSMERQLPQAVSSVDDRLSFMKVCLELDKKVIRYMSVDNEPHVGGLVLHITELSQVLEKKCPDFLKKLVRCCIRLDNKMRIQWPFECCMINAPLTRDCRKDAYRNQVCTWVQDMTSNGTNGNEGIAQCIVERLTRYLHIYEIVNKFAIAYKAHYHKYCNVVCYTYHKLILAYGEKRDQLLIISFKPTPPLEGYKLTFGQALSREQPDYIDVCWEKEINWNPHSLMSGILNTKFNKDRDLTDLVHYLISTAIPLQALSTFSRVRYQSCKVIAQVFNVDLPFPVRLKCHLSYINEQTVRLTYGSVHLEFAFLQENQVAVRDSSRVLPRAAGLLQFFTLIAEQIGSTVSNEDQDKVKHTESPTPRPESLPQHFETSPAGYNSSLLSVPAQMEGGSPSGTASPNRGVMSVSSTPFIIGHSTLVRACEFTEVEGGRMYSPLDDYLSQLNYLERMAAVFEACKNGTTQCIPSGTIKDVTHELDFVRVSVYGVQHQQGFNGNVANIITFHFYIDPSTMTLKLQLHYSDFGPGPNEQAMIERYFTKVVMGLNNELATLSFIQLCRMTNHNAVTCIARVMDLQMENNTFNIQLVYLAREPNVTARKFCCGVIIDSTTSYILILVSFRYKQHRMPDRHILKLLYCSKSNTVKQQGTEDDFIGSILAAANNESLRTGDCPVYTAIHQLHERVVAGLPIGSNQLARPPSVGGYMPGSVGSGTVNIGSTGGPVSVGNNPGSIMNPGSNSGM